MKSGGLGGVVFVMNELGKSSAPRGPRLSSDRWITLEPLIDAALDLPAAQRQTFIEEHCAGDAALGEELTRFLTAYDEPDTLLQHPAAAKFSALLDERPVELPAVLSDRYRLEGEIGRGGMATVYLAHDLRHDRKVAVKVLHAALAAALGANRFLAEIRTTARLHHPHILPLHDSGEVDGVLYYVMPFVEGESLRQRMAREKQLAVDDAVRITCEVAGALEAAHAQGVIHRDVKPENILLQNDAALVADFGIALAVGTAAGPRITNPGLAIGTPQYMSPEQATGAKSMDHRSDIYSLGAVLFEMLAGEPPFTGTSTTAIVAKLIALPAPSVRVVRAAIPVALDVTIAKSLAREPADRFRSAAEFAEALQRSLVPAVERVEPPRSIARTIRKRPGLALLGAAVMGIALLAGGVRWQATAKRAADANAVAAADTGLIALFPFANAEWPANSDVIDQAMRRALLRWKGVVVVDPFALHEASRKAETGSPTASQPRAAALLVHARRYIRGTVVTEGNELRITAMLYDAARPDAPLVEVDTLAGFRGAALDVALMKLADRLLFRTSDSTSLADRNIGTTSLAARQAFLRGAAEIDRWNLPAAESHFVAATKFDGHYPQASLWLALSRIWAEKDSATWRYAVEAASTGRTAMGDGDRDKTDALRALMAGDRPKACALWDALTRRAPADFSAWYGAAHCLARDQAVIADAHSPSGWRFRSGYHGALLRYRRAFELRPSVLSAQRREGFAQLRWLLWTSPNRPRLGVSGAKSEHRFLAWPALDHDTLVVIPFPFSLVETADAATIGRIPGTVSAAIKRQRELLREIATTWATANPTSVEAQQALGLSLFLLGDPSALDILSGARAIDADSVKRFDLVATEMWMRVLFSAPSNLAGLARARAC